MLNGEAITVSSHIERFYLSAPPTADISQRQPLPL